MWLFSNCCDETNMEENLKYDASLMKLKFVNNEIKDTAALRKKSLSHWLKRFSLFSYFLPFVHIDREGTEICVSGL